MENGFEKKRKNFEKAIDKRIGMWYNNPRENKAEHSALTSAPGATRVNIRPLMIIGGELPCGDVCLCTVYFFRLEVLNY